MPPSEPFLEASLVATVGRVATGEKNLQTIELPKVLQTLLQ